MDFICFNALLDKPNPPGQISYSKVGDCEQEYQLTWKTPDNLEGVSVIGQYLIIKGKNTDCFQKKWLDRMVAVATWTSPNFCCEAVSLFVIAIAKEIQQNAIADYQQNMLYSTPGRQTRLADLCIGEVLYNVIEMK